MGKRSNFERVERDFYPTPLEAVKPLIPHILPYKNFIEPCAGDGQLIDHFASFDKKCVVSFDIEPRRNDIIQGSYDQINWLELIQDLRALIGIDAWPDCFITNPPWDRKLLHP